MTVAIDDCPPDLARMQREAEELRAAKTAHRQAVEARRIGSMALIEQGMSVYSRTRRDRDDYPIGGIVASIGWSAPDPETGERVRVFTCLSSLYDGGRPFRIRHVREDEFGEANIEPANTSDLKGICARLDEACMRAHQKGGPVLPEIATWQEWARDLTVLIVYGGRR